jgi:hypothetical protein
MDYSQGRSEIKEVRAARILNKRKCVLADGPNDAARRQQVPYTIINDTKIAPLLMS